MIRIRVPEIKRIEEEYFGRLEKILPKTRSSISAWKRHDSLYNECKKEALKAYRYSVQEIVDAKKKDPAGVWEGLLGKVQKEFDKEFRKALQKKKGWKSKTSEEQDEAVRSKAQDLLVRSFFNYEARSQSLFLDGKNLRQWLVKKLGLQVCPYCNRDYIRPREQGSGKRGAELDHYKSQKDYFYLGLSFYNLIPSCYECNHTKLAEELDLYPYSCSSEQTLRFKQDDLLASYLDPSETRIKVEATKVGIGEKNIEVLNLEGLYQQHADLAQELTFKAQAYQEGYYDRLVETFEDLGLSSREMHQMIFGHYCQERDYQNVPLSKFTHDILDQLGVSDTL